jgi:integrase
MAAGAKRLDDRRIRRIEPAIATEMPQMIAVIRLLILTGARVGELLQLKHHEVPRDEMELHLTDTKVGFSRRPLSAAALAVIDGVERMPGSTMSFERSIRRLIRSPTTQSRRRSAASRKLPAFAALHSLRHWYSTMTANSVSNARVGMALTGHKSHPAYR